MTLYDHRAGAPRAQTYLEVANKLLGLAADAKTLEAREQFVALAALYQGLARTSRALEWAPLPPPLSPQSHPAQSSWQGNFLRFHRDTVLAQVPTVPGVYALWSASQWVYVGESGNLRNRLLAHVAGDGGCIVQQQARGFGFEHIEDARQRAARARALICELMPVCNAVPG